MADYEQAVFISYAWGGEREDIVNEIDETLQRRGIRIVRDKRALGYKGSIKEFMELIGRGSCVIVVISDKYLRSPNCMFELVEIAENKQFYDRVFPVVLSDANIYDPLKRIEYVKHWEAKRKELAKSMKTLDPANLQGIRDDMDQYDRIRDKISGITSILKDMNTLTPEMHRDSEFSNLYDAIVERLKENAEIERMKQKAEAESPVQARPEALSTSFMLDQVKLIQSSALLKEGKQLLKDGNLRQAAQVFRQILTLMPDHEITKTLLAETEAKILEVDKGAHQAKEVGGLLAAQEADTQRLLAKEKGDQEKLVKASTLMNQGEQLLKDGDPRGAVRMFRQILTLIPNHEITLKLLMEAEAKISQEEQAKAEAERRAKEEADRSAAQNAQVSVSPKKKPVSKGLVVGIVVVVLLIIGGIGMSFLGKSGSNKALNAQVAIAQPTRTQAPAPTKKPTTKATEPPTHAPAPAPTEKAKSTSTVIAPSPTVPVVNVESLIKTAHILVYEDTAEEGLWIEPMMKEVGYAENAKFVHDRVGDLKTELTSSNTKWDLIVIAAESHSAVSGEFWGYIKDQLDAGTGLILETWAIDIQGEGKIKPILEGCGTKLQANFDVAIPLTWYAPGDPLFNEPNQVPELSRLNRYWQSQAGDLMKLAPGSNATIIAGTSSSLADSGVIAHCYDGRMVLQTFSNHDYPKTQISDLWQNYIYNTLKNHFSK